MPISSLHVESDFAVAAHNDQIQLRFSVKHRPHSGQMKVCCVVDAATGCTGIRCGSQHLRTQTWLVAVWKHVDGQPINHVSDDAAQLAVNLRFVDTKPLWQPWPVFGVESVDVVAGQVADGFVIASNKLGDVQERLAKTLRLNELNTSAGHSTIRVNATQGLNESSSALSALEPLSIGKDAYRTASDGAVADVDWLWSMLVQVADVSALGARLGRHGVFGFNHILVAVSVLVGWRPAFEVKNVSHALPPPLLGRLPGALLT